MPGSGPLPVVVTGAPHELPVCCPVSTRHAANGQFG